MNNNEPITIGKIKKGGGSKPIVVVILFLFLGAFLLFLPTIINYFGDYNIIDLVKEGNIVDFFINHDLYVNNKETEKEQVEKDQNKEIIYVNNKTIIEENGIRLDNFNLSRDGINFNITNNNNIDLDSTYIYLLLKKDGKILSAIRLLNIDKIDFKFETRLESLIQIEALIKHYTDSDYPNLSLTTDESGIGSINCVKEHNYYEYIFENNKLIKVKETFKYYDDGNNNNYLDNFNKYSKLNKDIINNNGLSTLEENNNGFVFKTDIDLSTYTKNIDYNYYSYNTKSNKINFDMEAKGYDCK